MSFLSVWNDISWDQTYRSIQSKTATDVERALDRPTGTLSLQDFQALVSPVAQPYLESIAKRSHQLTVERFGYTQQMYTPVYLSNVCSNICTYCGFSANNKIPRKILNWEEIEIEFEAVKAMGMDHILLVTGESNRQVGLSYLKKAIQIARNLFSSISIEVQPMDQESYQALMESGLSSVLVYQETYHREAYAQYHRTGMKRNFDYRLETPDRLGRAGIKKIGIGALYGLEDWRTDSSMVALHLQYLEQRYWKTRYSLSFPRIRPHEGDFAPLSVMSDKDLVQLIGAFRLLSPEVELSLSTREDPAFRDQVHKLGITTLSAGSKTNPGGYRVDPQTLAQFEIADHRSPQAVSRMLQKDGYQVVWKDWDPTYDGASPQNKAKKEPDSINY